jgi:hypothetical protein
MDKAKLDAMVWASGFFLTDNLDEEVLTGDEEDLEEFIRNNLWEPFEYWSVDNVYEQIESLANSALSKFCST